MGEPKYRISTPNFETPIDDEHRFGEAGKFL
jgi:hypothetical protein